MLSDFVGDRWWSRWEGIRWLHICSSTGQSKNPLHHPVEETLTDKPPRSPSILQAYSIKKFICLRDFTRMCNDTEIFMKHHRLWPYPLEIESVPESLSCVNESCLPCRMLVEVQLCGSVKLCCKHTVNMKHSGSFKSYGKDVIMRLLTGIYTAETCSGSPRRWGW